jgi:predicted transcriptional regulator
MSDIEQQLLNKLNQSLVINDTWDFAEELNIDHQIIIGALKSLSVDSYICDEPISTTYWTLTKEGEQVLNEGSPEFRGFRRNKQL